MDIPEGYHPSIQPGCPPEPDTKKNGAFLYRWWPLGGALALCWFVIRVVPKPSRATYPCQQAAFPVASGFVVWLLALASSFVLAHRSHKNMRGGRPLSAVMGVVVAALILVINGDSPTRPAASAVTQSFVPVDGPNEPMGSPIGVFPGRVAWLHRPEVTRWNGTDGYWWEDDYTDPLLVADMVEQGLRSLTNATDAAAAWETLFVYFNSQHNKGSVGYRAGETIAIKVNLNQIGSYAHPGNALFPAPQVVMALLRQLVYQAGVDPQDIVLYDVTRYFPDALAVPIQSEFPTVQLVDWQGEEGRQRYQRDEECPVRWSQELILEKDGGNPTYVPTCASQADYLINLTNLKGHSLAGITLGAKNFFGSICADRNGQPASSAPQGAGLHPYVAVHDFSLGNPVWESFERPMGTYNPLVDLLGHQDLGGKTLLFIVDGLYATPEQNGFLRDGHQWQSAPFNGHWPSSIFFSQDAVAIESVGLDFLRSEPTQNQVYGSVDNYLHEAALAGNPPSGVVYDPEGDGTALENLGAHEHWDNPVDKRYSGNLGLAGGIELVGAPIATAVEEQNGLLPQAATLKNRPNPFNATTQISFALPHAGDVRLDIYTSSGQHLLRLFDQSLIAGHYSVAWDGQDGRGIGVGSGIYFARLTTPTAAINHKLLLLR
jgi:hypothetical protein